MGKVLAAISGLAMMLVLLHGPATAHLVLRYKVPGVDGASVGPGGGGPGPGPGGGGTPAEGSGEGAGGPGALSAISGQDAMYFTHDWIEFEASFPEAVSADPGTTLPLQIGPNGGAVTTRQASLQPASNGTDTLVFRYTFVTADNDTDGIEIAADALLGSDITALDDGAAMELTSATLTTGALVNFTSIYPIFERLTQTSGSWANPMREGNSANLYLRYHERVDITPNSGSVHLEFDIGGELVESPPCQTMHGGSDTYPGIECSYTVAAGAYDPDGLEVVRIVMHGDATFRATEDNVEVPLTINPSRVDWAPRVDARAGITGITSSSHPDGVNLSPGDDIVFAVSWPVAVDVTGTPELKVYFGMNERRARYESGDGSDTLHFLYTVQAGDEDQDGVTIPADAVALAGGSLMSGSTSVSTSSADGDAFALPRIRAQADTLGPFATALSQSSGSGASPMREGNSANLYLRYNERVVVTPNSGSVHLEFDIGGELVESQPCQTMHGGSDTYPGLECSYSVAAGEYDSDGIETTRVKIVGDATVTAHNDGTAASLDLTTATVSWSPTVDARAGITGITSSSHPDGVNLSPGDDIVFAVSWPVAVDVTGTPELKVYFGMNERRARYESGDGSDTLHFLYTVQAGDEDQDGVTIPADAVALAGGSLMSGSTSVSTSSADGDAFALPRIRAQADTLGPFATALSQSSGSGASPMREGNSANLYLRYNERVVVTPNSGSVHLEFDIGGELVESQPCQTMHGGSDTYPGLECSYSVAAGEYDSDGIETTRVKIVGDATVTAHNDGTAASLDLTTATVSWSPTVDARAGIVDVRLGIPPDSASYKEGETMSFEVEYAEAVTVTGTPLLNFPIGMQTRQASYASGTGTAVLVFDYVVLSPSEDQDGDGTWISGSDAIVLNGGSIRTLSGNHDASPGMADGQSEQVTNAVVN